MNRVNKAHQSGFRQGMLVALTLASPFIVIGGKWLYANRKKISEKISQTKELDIYTKFFNKALHEEKKANKTLNDIRQTEGHYDVVENED